MMMDRINQTNSSALENAAQNLMDAIPAISMGGVAVKLSLTNEAPWLVSCRLSLALPDGKARPTNFMTEGPNKTHAAAAMLAVIKKALADLKEKKEAWEAQWVLDGVVAYLKANGMFDDVSKVLEEGLF